MLDAPTDYLSDFSELGAPSYQYTCPNSSITLKDRRREMGKPFETMGSVVDVDYHRERKIKNIKNMQKTRQNRRNYAREGWKGKSV